MSNQVGNNSVGLTYKNLKPRALRPPILVIGLNGVPGYALFRYFNKFFGGTDTFSGERADIYPAADAPHVPGDIPLIGIRPIKHPCVYGENVVALDAEDTEGLAALFAKYRFNTVIDASGNCALKACECDTLRSKLLNYSQGVDAAHLAKKYNCTFVRISTDMVWSGSEATAHLRPYKDDAPKDPIHNYGKHQLEAEIEIQKILPECVMLRVPLPMDYAPGGCAGAVDWISYRFKPGWPATLYTDEYRNPIYGGDMCRVVQYILEHQFPPGIYNCGGPRRVTLYNAGQLVNAIGGYPPELLHGCPRIEAGPLPPRVGDLTINSEKLYKLLPPGFIRPWPFDDRIVPTHKDWHKTFGRHIKDKSKMGSEEAIRKLLVLGEKADI
ncbi:MAG: sugar nucleotide-binding protein [Fibrobacteraceae bacterium]|nr:sugar nucleotide-binding protein [Fibrobacteraceae bacterium]